ncbi:MAG: YvcK family protein [Clostridia bacterium]
MKEKIKKYIVQSKGIKRYILIQIISIVLCIFISYKTSSNIDLAIYIILGFVIVICTFLIQRKSMAVGVNHLSKEEKLKEIDKRIKNDNVLSRGPKVVIIGGGSGLGNILKGLKEHTSNITAIVTTFDDGSSTGILKKEFDVLAPGDIRQCITSLSTSESSMERLLSYRFKDGHLDNHSLGNLFLVAMTDIMGSFPVAIKKISDIFSVIGRVLPITLDKMTLCCEYTDGTTAIGEDAIPKQGKGKKIKKIYLNEKNAKPAPEVLESIKEADVILLGPGSLYCSVICNLLVSDVSETIMNAKGKKIYICNIMTQNGETDNYTLSDHVNEVEKYLGNNVLDYVFANDSEITEEMLEQFKQINSKSVIIDKDKIKNKNTEVITSDYILTMPGKILHNNKKISQDIIELAKKTLSQK